MKTPTEYEQIIKNLIFNNWRSYPFFEHEDDDKAAYYKYVIYLAPYHAFVFDAKEEDTIADAVNYFFDKVMEIEK